MAGQTYTLVLDAPSQVERNNTARLSMVLLDSAHNAAAATVVSVKVQPPTGSAVTYTLAGAQVVADSTTGNYHLDVTCNQSGRWQATGTTTPNAVDSAEWNAIDNLVP